MVQNTPTSPTTMPSVVDCALRRWIDSGVVDAMFALGADLPQLCSEIYAVLRVPTERVGNP